MNPYPLCDVCKGSGELETERRESDTGYPLTVACGVCNGQGYLIPADVPALVTVPLPKIEDSEIPF